MACEGEAKASEGGLRVVVNADDLGYDAQRDEGILRSFREGVVTSASLMVNGASAETAAKLSKEANLPVGLHLNLTEGRPCCSASKVPSLLADDGFMLGKQGFRKGVRSEVVEAQHIAAEVNAQLDAFVALTGSAPTHVDGHQHVHVMPLVAPIIAKAMAARGLRSTRIPGEASASFHWVSKPRRTFYDSIRDQCATARDVFAAHGVLAPAAFVGYGVMGADMTVERVVARLEEELAAGTASCELMVHPGLVASADGVGCGGGVDDFALSSDREHEMKLLCSAALAAWFRKHGVLLVSHTGWR